MHSARARGALLTLSLLVPLSAQDRPSAHQGLPQVFAPEGHADGDWRPFVVVWGAPEAAAVLRARGLAGVVVDGACDGAQLQPLMARMRQRFRIDQGGAHAVVAAHADVAVTALLAQRHEFRSVTSSAAAAPATAALDVLRFRVVQRLDVDAWGAIAEAVAGAHAAGALDGAAGEVARALDSFHDAAAVGDEARYFALLPDDAVFLGTDATERWTGAQFRSFATPYFERPSAWTYVCLRRAVTVAADGATAWFDELLDNAHYGECRGSGVLQRRDGRWVLRQYNLTVPVPNELMGDVAQRVRSFVDGEAPAVSTLVLAVGGGAEAALAGVPIAMRYGGEGGEPSAGDASPAAVRKLRRAHRGGTVLLHVDRAAVAEWLRAAGVSASVDVPEGDSLIVVTFGVGGPRALPLRLSAAR